jgi:hypothetical protein
MRDRHSRCASGIRAFLFHPELSIRLGAKPTPDLAAAAVASDFHRERLGAVGDNLVLLHPSSMAWRRLARQEGQAEIQGCSADPLPRILVAWTGRGCLQLVGIAWYWMRQAATSAD